MPRFLLAALLAACGDQGLRPVDTDAYSGESPLVPTDDAFVQAERTTGVPADLLVAVSYTETGLQMVAGEEEFPGQPKGHGLMGLRDGDLELAAALAGIKPDFAATDRAANILAAAYLLADWGDQLGIDGSDLDAWAPVVAAYSGILDADGQDAYVDRVYASLDAGIEAEGLSIPPRIGGVARPPRDLPPDKARTGDAAAIWTPSPNYNSRGGANVDFIIVHTCEGNYASCWSWLASSASGVSAHYVVDETGSEVRQLVDEGDRAWHIAANYDCNNNFGVECWRDGTSMNTISVGIEHAGYASQSSWDPGLIERSAELACGITQRQDIPRDSYHIVGHGQLQPYDRTDPGPNWPWPDYLARIGAACGDTSGGGTTSSPATGTYTPPPAGANQIVIDSNNAANDTSSYYVEVSADWWASTNVAGYWNTGYWVGATDSVSDPASFWFYNDQERCWTAEAWWTAAWDRNPSTTFIGWDPWNGEVGRATVDETVNGSQWNWLGQWTYPAGWNRVILSRWATPGSYVIADAVRMTPCN